MAKQHPPLLPLDERQRYSIGEAATYLRIARPSLYRLINGGEIATITHGRRRFVPGSEIARLSRAPAAAAA